MKTKVIFKKEDGHNILAVFPQEPGTYDRHTCSIYSHVGQHGAADLSYCAQLPPAKPAEYAGLLRELTLAPYNYDFVIGCRITRRDDEVRKAALR